MTTNTQYLACLGFDDGYLQQTNSTKLNSLSLARVITVDKNSYCISDGNKEVFAELAGKLMYSADSGLELPTVGDWVYAQFYDEQSHAIIHEILPRKTLLKRKSSGRAVDYQLIAANIDIAFIIQSLDHNFNIRRLERFLVMVNESHIHPVALLSKSDLLESVEITSKIAEITALMPDIEIIYFSNENEQGLDAIRTLLKPGETSCFLGSSGVGKTTLLNHLLGRDVFDTQSVREKDSKGRHTTTRRHLIQLDNGAMIIDTPGMRELGNMAVDSGLDETFSDIITLTRHCQFNDCTHVNEKGCAVLAAIEHGELLDKRYQNYMKMRKESDYFEMSYIDKKKKDRAFGKMCKSVMKHKK